MSDVEDVFWSDRCVTRFSMVSRSADPFIIISGEKGWVVYFSFLRLVCSWVSLSNKWSSMASWKLYLPMSWLPGRVGVDASLLPWLCWKAGELPPQASLTEKLAALWGSSEALPVLKQTPLLLFVVPILRLQKKAWRLSNWGCSGSVWVLWSLSSSGDFSYFCYSGPGESSSHSSTAGCTRIVKLDKLDLSSRLLMCSIELSSFGSLK